MPIVHITLIEGRKSEEIEKCMKDVAESIHLSLNAPLETIRIMVQEVPPNRFAVGTKLKSDK